MILRVKNTISLAVVLLAVGLARCTSTPTRVDRGPIAARTFSFVKTGQAAMPAYADPRTELHAMIQGAIAANLDYRGLSQVASGGDVTVAYLVIVGNNATTTSLNDYFGYNRDDAGLVKKAHQAMAIDNQNPNLFEAGTLVIDLIDGKSFELLKRNYAVRPILRDATAELRQERIGEAVEEALRDLRIKK